MIILKRYFVGEYILITKDYLNLLLVSYDSGEYIEEFGGYYADIIDNYVLILLDYKQIINHLNTYERFDDVIISNLSILNTTSFNNFNDYSTLIENELHRASVYRVYHKSYIDAEFCRRIYLDE